MIRNYRRCLLFAAAKEEDEEKGAEGQKKSENGGKTGARRDNIYKKSSKFLKKCRNFCEKQLTNAFRVAKI